MNPFSSLVKRHAVLVFALLTVTLTFATYFVPLPADSRALIFPVLVVFIPAIVAIALTAATDGRAAAKRLLRASFAWRVGFKWTAIALGVALVLRLGISVLGQLVGAIPAIQIAAPSFFSLMFFVFALPEEIGWRGYALPKLLHNHSPLAASLLLGLPWSLLHLSLLLPGMMAEGVSPVAQMLPVIALSVFLTRIYCGAGNSLVAATLFHGAQSAFGILNVGLNAAQSGWLMATVYGAAAVIAVIADRQWWLSRPAAIPMSADVRSALIGQPRASK